MPSIYEEIICKLRKLEKSVKSANCCPTAVSYTPTSSTDTFGVVGEIAYDNNYFYVKTSQGWKRISLTTF